MTGTNGQLFGWAPEVWLLLDQLGILAGLAAFISAIIGVVYGWLRRDKIRRWFRANRFPKVGHELADIDRRWDAVVFTVSNPDLPIWVLEQIRPRTVALLATEQSNWAAERIEQAAERLGIRYLGTLLVTDPDNPAESKECARTLIDRQRQQGAQSPVMDVTGGKTPMSIGAFMAAEELGVPTLYVTAQFDPNLKRPDPRSARIRCISHPEAH